KQRPVMIHRALFGSIERFFAVLLEHYAGAFPPARERHCCAAAAPATASTAPPSCRFLVQRATP
ncbi:hypothetical protein, partial [Streptomyces eurythermus]|uniref:hypothetical protein n=1 Tax=Streptomyces eurythermus TaxID=42237 RepID=UPI0033E4A47A